MYEYGRTNLRVYGYGQSYKGTDIEWVGAVGV